MKKLILFITILGLFSCTQPANRPHIYSVHPYIVVPTHRVVHHVTIQHVVVVHRVTTVHHVYHKR